MKKERISLSAINADDKRYQVRDPRTSTFGEREDQKKTSRRHIQSIVKALTDNPKTTIEPIEVVQDPNNEGQYIIVDGFHRYNAFSSINQKTKGRRFKQIRVNVHTEEVSLARALSINTEHNALPLTTSHRTELQWQQFLDLTSKGSTLSKRETSELIAVSESTIGNWRRLRKQFEDAGFFQQNSLVAKHPITGYPMLKPSRDALKEDEWLSYTGDTTGELKEEDKTIAQMILKEARKATEPVKLEKFIRHYLGSPTSAINYDIDVDELENNDDF